MHLCNWVILRSYVFINAVVGVMSAQPRNHFVFCVVVVEFAVNGNQALKGSLPPIVNHFPILRKNNNSFNNFSQCPLAQHLLAVCKQLLCHNRVNV